MSSPNPATVTTRKLNGDRWAVLFLLPIIWLPQRHSPTIQIRVISLVSVCLLVDWTDPVWNYALRNSQPVFIALIVREGVTLWGGHTMASSDNLTQEWWPLIRGCAAFDCLSEDLSSNGIWKDHHERCDNNFRDVARPATQEQKRAWRDSRIKCSCSIVERYRELRCSNEKVRSLARRNIEDKADKYQRNNEQWQWYSRKGKKQVSFPVQPWSSVILYVRVGIASPSLDVEHINCFWRPCVSRRKKEMKLRSKLCKSFGWGWDSKGAFVSRMALESRSFIGCTI